MPIHLHAKDVAHTPNGSLKFEGDLYKFPVSFFLIADQPGNSGPPLHMHPYPELWVVRAGKAKFIAGDEVLHAGAGDILKIDENTPHKYSNAGDTVLELTCIHASPTMIQKDLE